jgi:hypothetical protein
MRYRILIEQDEDGVFVAECPSLPGVVFHRAIHEKRQLATFTMQ